MNCGPFNAPSMSGEHIVIALSVCLVGLFDPNFNTGYNLTTQADIDLILGMYIQCVKTQFLRGDLSVAI